MGEINEGIGSEEIEESSTTNEKKNQKLISTRLHNLLGNFMLATADYLGKRRK